MEITQETAAVTLLVSDRCDYCQSQAYVLVRGMSGELLFCAHDYAKIINDPIGKEKLEAFAFEIVDEREKLNENRLVGEN
ncbi:MAG: hypothetical protein WAO41_08795 [Candidatus Nanopelagicales bacterium]